MCSYVFPFLLLSSFLSFLFLLHFVFFCIYSSDHSSRLKLGNLDGTTPCFEDVWNLRLSSRFVAMNLLPTPYPLRTTIYLHIEVRPFFWGNVTWCYMYNWLYVTVYPTVVVVFLFTHFVTIESHFWTKPCASCIKLQGIKDDLKNSPHFSWLATTSHCRMHLRSYQSDFTTKDWDLTIEQYML